MTLSRTVSVATSATHHVVLISQCTVVSNDIPLSLAGMRHSITIFLSCCAALRDIDVIAMASCVIIDLDTANSEGLSLQNKLIEMKSLSPVIFITSKSDVSTSISAMKAGALDFLQKPVSYTLLMETVSAAVRLCQDRRHDNMVNERLRATAAALTDRQREVLGLIANGLTNEQVAERLRITIDTVKFHRGSLMRILKVHTRVDLLRRAFAIEDQHTRPHLSFMPNGWRYPYARIRGSV